MSLHPTSSAADANHRLLAFSDQARQSGRSQTHDSAVDVPGMDTEAVLSDCEEFLVDGPGGREIGVVYAIEREGPGGTVSSLLVATGWFGRRHLRVDRRAIEAVFLDERRIVARTAHPVPRETEGA